MLALNRCTSHPLASSDNDFQPPTSHAVGPGQLELPTKNPEFPTFLARFRRGLILATL